MAAKFPTQLFAIFGGDGKITYHTELVSALTGSPTGRTVAVYVLQKVRSGKLIAEWEPEPAPEVMPRPSREEL